MHKTAVVVLNWNGKPYLAPCLDALRAQTLKHHIIVVDNASSDDSVAFLKKEYPDVELVVNSDNLGFAGGVNSGIRQALKAGYHYIGLLNNDAIPKKTWLKHLAQDLDEHENVGIVTSKILTADGKRLDSTGDYYTTWGLPYPRGRGQQNSTAYDKLTDIFSASGGASLYRSAMLQKIGLFDEDFFMYYEDVDISFRAQLAGWKVRFAPEAIVHHEIGGSSGKVKGLSVYQTMKNQPLLLQKNVPGRYLFRVGWRFTLAHTLFFLRAISRGQGWPALKGDLRGTQLLFSGFKKRRLIQNSKSVSDEYIWGMFVHDLPPNAQALRKLRGKWWKLTRRRQT